MKQSSLKSNFIYNVAYQILVLIVPLITSPYLTRTIGAEGLGVYSFTQSFAHYFVLCIMLGVNNYGNREIARTRDNKEECSKTFWEIYSFQFILLCALTLIYCGYLVIRKPENLIIYVFQMLYVVSAGFDINWACFGLERFRLTVIRNACIKVFSTIAIFTLVHDSSDLGIYTVIIAGGCLISQLALWPFILKEFDLRRPSWPGIKRHIKPNLMLFLPVIAVSLYTIMDKLMLGVMSTKVEVGYYAYAERVIQIPSSIVAALGTVMLPRASNLVRNGHGDQGKNLLVRSMQFAMLISIGCGFGVMAISKELIPWYYGADFTRCALFTAWLAPVVYLTSWNSVIRTQYVIPYGYDRIYLATVSVGAVVNLILNVLFIRTYQGIGAVIATDIAQFAVCFVQYLLLKNKLDYKEFRSDTVCFFVTGLAMFIGLYILPDFSKVDIVNILYKILVGAAFYCTVTIGYLACIKKDTRLIRSIMSISRRRR